MSRTKHLCLMAEYNAWMNTKLYAAAATLPSDELVADRYAYFGSIMGTLNHLIVGDTIWLKRFAMHSANYASLETVRQLPKPKNLNQIMHLDIESLSKQRHLLDLTMIEWAKSIAESDLDCALNYTNMSGVVAHKNFYSLVVHLFNHQTHHRGQATTLLTQAGVDVGVTDLLALIPNVD